MKKLSLIPIISVCLFIPVLAQADSFEAAVEEAKIEIDKAKAVNYEWRDSRKMLTKAEKLNKEGKNDQAMKLVAQAKKQGEIAVAQAELQSSVNGPR
jgi:hypothetical protein